MPRPRIGTTDVPWLSQHARLFEETVRQHGQMEGPLIRSHKKLDREGIAQQACVSAEFVERLSWFEENPLARRYGSRERTKVAAVLLVMGWELDAWLDFADGRISLEDLNP